MKYGIVLVACVLVGCTSPKEANRVLSQAGYKDIKYTGYSFFSCGNDDTFHTGFKATSPSGQVVEGTVCSGFLKGATIRLD